MPGNSAPRLIAGQPNAARFSVKLLVGDVATSTVQATMERTFTTLVHRALHTPLTVRMHYGHPDLLDKLKLMTTGGVSTRQGTLGGIHCVSTKCAHAHGKCGASTNSPL